MPADVVGTMVHRRSAEGRGIASSSKKGPIFAKVVLADEINRATPKTQSALLEAMQERSVTVGGQTYKLAEPFLVMATQNPVEQEGTYPLPEAQLDRFIFKLVVGYSQLQDLITILDRTTGSDNPEASKVIDGPRILEMQKLVKDVIVAPHVKEYVARLVLATHPGTATAAGGPTGVTNKYVRCGASPRAAQSLMLGGKVKALIDGRFHVSFGDIKSIAAMSLRHRVLLNFEAEADKVDSDGIVKQIMDAVPTEGLRAAAV
jgi:MoxR-like ATPase